MGIGSVAGVDVNVGLLGIGAAVAYAIAFAAVTVVVGRHRSCKRVEARCDACIPCLPCLNC